LRLPPHDPQAVSYTHLDVYKRQEKSFAIVDQDKVCLLYTSRCV